MDPAFLAGVDYTDDKDDEDDEDNEDTSIAEVPIPNTTVMINTQTMTRTQNLITTPLTPTRLMTIQAKHPYTAPEATYPFTVPLVNHHNILWMRKTIFPKIKPKK